MSTGAPPPPVPVDPPKVNFAAVQAFHATQSALEATDKAKVVSFLDVTKNELEAALYTWAAGGFVNGAEVLTLALVAPAKCADNVTRSLIDYASYLSGESPMVSVMRMNKGLSGIRLGLRPNTTGLAILAFKAA
jgi:hypothetical protein